MLSSRRLADGGVNKWSLISLLFPAPNPGDCPINRGLEVWDLGVAWRVFGRGRIRAGQQTSPNHRAAQYEYAFVRRASPLCLHRPARHANPPRRPAAEMPPTGAHHRAGRSAQRRSTRDDLLHSLRYPLEPDCIRHSARRPTDAVHP